MALHELAGKPVPPAQRPQVQTIITDYYTLAPDPAEPTHQVAFGTSGHRGVAADRSFNEAHILAITQAICDHRAAAGIDGPLFLGMDTHALSEPAHRTALEVLAANGVDVRTAAGTPYTPTPVISHAILTWNAAHDRAQADGLVITPSHNPPDNGGIKYNPPAGGPAPQAVTAAIADAANAYLADGNRGVKRVPWTQARQQDTVTAHDYVKAYTDDLGGVIDMDAVRGAGLRLGVDALAGSGLGFWEAVAETYGLDINVRNSAPDTSFGFMTLDHDGKIRMDCSSPHAMAGLIALKDDYDVAFGNDPDYDRHGIVTPSHGLMNPNHGDGLPKPGPGQELVPRGGRNQAGQARATSRRCT